jgi:outer membrane protein
MLRWNGVRLLALCLPLAAPALYAQVKIAVVDTQAALAETAEIKKAQADLEAKYKPRQEQFQKLQKELESLQQQLNTLSGKLTPQAQNEMSLQAQRKQRELQRFSEDLQADVDRERNEILSRASQRLKTVIDKLAEEKGLDLVFDLNDTVYHKPALDITKEATAAYDKAYPVK